MGTRANRRRERILSTAESIILRQGFAGTTIEEIIDKAAITKSGFFYHFNGKSELARALIDRYIQMDTDVFTDLSKRADTLSEDPLQQALIFLNLFTEMVGGMTDVHPGCLAAAFTYESSQFDPEIRQRINAGMMSWRQIIVRRLNEIAAKYPPRIEVDIESLADMFTSCVEGGIILAMAANDNSRLVQQVQNYRQHLRLVFDDL
ncbi:MAG: TetR/AcrR family transcriptional regulator [Gammaproteobacteria bacterium]